MNRIQREPVGIVALVVAFIQACILAAITLDYITWTTEQTVVVMAVVVAGGAIATWIISRYFVTPLADPKDRDGNALVPDVQP